MKPSRVNLGIALSLGALFGALGGFMIGRVRLEANERKATAAAAAAHAPGPVVSVGTRKGSDLASEAKSGRKATIDLSGLPPAEAWRRLMEIGDPSVKADAVRLLLDSMPPAEWPIWLATMIESFKDEGFDDHDPGKMAALFGSLDTLMQQMAATHPRECLTAMLSLGKEHSHGDDMIEVLVTAWARRDLQAAREFYDQEIAGRGHGKADDIAKSLVREMAKADPQGTLEWAARLTDGQARGRGMMAAFDAIMKADRKEAITLLTTRTDLPDRPRLAEQVASNWARSEPGRALEWAQTLPDDLRAAASSRAFDAWLRQDFNAARAAFDASAPEARGLLLPALVQRAPKEQLGALADELTREPATAGRTQVSQTLMRQWVEQDPTAASGWLARQPAGEVQDYAIVGFIGWADGNEPQAALEWAGTISDPRLRAQNLQELIERYRSSEPAVARSWLNSTTRLTPDERTRFLELTGK